MGLSSLASSGADLRTSFLAACATKGPGPSPCLYMFPDMFRSLPRALSMPQGQLEEHACVACVDKLECGHV